MTIIGQCASLLVLILTLSLVACSPSYNASIQNDELSEAEFGQIFADELRGSMKTMLDSYAGDEPLEAMIFCTTDIDEVHRIEIISCSRIK